MGKTMEAKFITPNEAKKFVKKLIYLAEEGREDFPPPAMMMWGRPGVGKTTVVYEACKEEGVPLLDIKLSQETPVSVVGLWYPDRETKTTHRFFNESVQRLIDRDRQGGVSVVFLDELIEAHPDTLSAIWELVNERKLQSYKFRHLVVIAASNYQESKVLRINRAFWNRFMHFNVDPIAQNPEEGAKQVAEYILKKTGCAHVYAYLRAFPDNVYVEKEAPNLLDVTPRTWEKVAVSCCVYRYHDWIEGFHPQVMRNFLSMREILETLKPFEHYLQHPEEISQAVAEGKAGHEGMMKIYYVIAQIENVSAVKLLLYWDNFVKIAQRVEDAFEELAMSIASAVKRKFESRHTKEELLSMSKEHFSELCEKFGVNRSLDREEAVEVLSERAWFSFYRSLPSLVELRNAYSNWKRGESEAPSP